MYLATWDSNGLMVLPHCFSVRCLKQAVHLAVRIVKKLYLANTKLVRLLLLRILRDLLDRLIRELQIIVKIHELGHRDFLLSMRLLHWP